MGTIGWKPSGAVGLGMGGCEEDVLLVEDFRGCRISTQSRMREWQKKIVVEMRTKMKRMWISWPTAWVRAIATSEE